MSNYELALNIPLFSISDLLGSCLITMCLAIVLYGITVAQTCIYCASEANDRFWIKATVAAVWMLENAHTVLMIRAIYYYFVSAFGDYLGVLKIDWSVGYVILTEICIVLLVEGFYLRRIWRLSNKNVFVVGSLTVLLIARSGIYAAAGGLLIVGQDWVTFQASRTNNLVVDISAALAAAVDGLVAAAMVYYLRRSRTGAKRTDGFIRWLMAYSVNSGVILVFFSTAVAVTHVYLGHSLVFAGVTTMTSKLYANTFLGTLNGRNFMRHTPKIAPSTMYLTSVDPVLDYSTGSSSGSQPSRFDKETIQEVPITNIENSAREQLPVHYSPCHADQEW
ncbi:hypothetical protein K474DRAFT_1660886 [Panus rudis PR-1116 ss-1]|nr:hypothetical protein K474DRAFT_1660886 [Panus rudis PR-1116 ss-1]